MSLKANGQRKSARSKFWALCGAGLVIALICGSVPALQAWQRKQSAQKACAFSTRWKTLLPCESWREGFLRDGRAWCLGMDSRLYVFGADGQLQWQSVAQPSRYQKLIDLESGLILLADEAGNVQVIDRNGGASPLLGCSGVENSSAIAICKFQNTVVGVNETGQAVWTLTSSLLADDDMLYSRESADCFYVTDKSKGVRTLSPEGVLGPPIAGARGYVDQVLPRSDGSVVLASSEHTTCSNPCRLTCISIAKTVAWEQLQVVPVTALEDDTLIIEGGYGEDGVNVFLACLDTKGKELWRFRREKVYGVVVNYAGPKHLFIIYYDMYRQMTSGGNSQPWLNKVFPPKYEDYQYVRLNSSGQLLAQGNWPYEDVPHEDSHHERCWLITAGRELRCVEAR